MNDSDNLPRHAINTSVPQDMEAVKQNQITWKMS